jgi:hypothetical protein
MNSPAPPPEAFKEPALAGTPAVMAERIEIFPTAPLPHLDAPHAKAFAARALGETRSTMVALVCTDDVPLRGDSFANFLNCDHPALMRFRDQGIIEWPITGRREPVVIFSRPAGERLDRIYAAPQKAMEDDALISAFIRPMADLLIDLAARGLTHGNIHLANAFRNSATGEVQLGEALSAPPSSSQPALYCTIERSQCPPTGRGMPASGDDIYALGVLGMILALGYNPWATLDDSALLTAKIEKGSFFALLGDIRLKGSLVELFRGMLDDNPRRRWSLDDLQTWLSGRRPAPRASEENIRASRPLTINGISCTTLRMAAHALTKDVMQGAVLIENGELERWLVHSIASDKHLAALKRMLIPFQSGSRSSTYHDQIVAHVAMALDPIGPLRYRGLALMPSGVGYYLGILLVKGGNIQPVAELITSGLPAKWVDEQYEGRAEYLHTLQLLEHARAMLEKRDIGFGVERVAYEMLPAMPCLSPAVRSACCRTVRDLLEQMNVAAAQNAGRDLADRHAVAFILAHEKRIPPQLVFALSAQEGTPQRAIAVLRLLAEAQYRQGPESLPNLTEWMAGRMEPVARRFFEKSMQEKIRGDLQAAARTGKLAKLLECIDGGDKLNRDRDMFERARYEYARSSDEIADLQLDIENRRAVEIKVGQPIASAIAAIVGFVAIALVIMMAVIGIGI